MKRIEVTNEVNGRQYLAELEEPKATEWKDKQIAKNTWGKPEREINYKTELIDGEDIQTIDDSFDEDLVDRILSEREEVTDLMGDPVGPEYEGIIYKRYFRTVKADYVVTETDITAEVAEKEQKEADKKAKKEAATVTLAGIASLDLTKKVDLDTAIRSIVEYLEIEITE